MTELLRIVEPNPARRGLWAARTIMAVVMLLMFGAYDSFFTVSEGEAIVITRFGRPTREIVKPGPYFKLPAPIEQKHIIDRRRVVFTAPESAAFSADKRSIVLTCFVIWHVEQPLVYLQSVGDPETAQSRLTSMLLAAENQRIGTYPLSALVSTNPGDVQLEKIETQIREDLSSMAFDKMGIAVDQVSVERIAFPEENLAAVFERMRTERQAEANRPRAEGSKEAQAIRDKTHVETQEILRKGREEAARITAEAERRAAELLSSAHQKNPEFYQFWSSLQASKRVLKEKATLILSSDQLFFGGLDASATKSLLDDHSQPEKSKSKLQPDGVPEADPTRSTMAVPQKKEIAEEQRP